MAFSPSRHATDQKLETEGVEFPYLDGSTLTLGRHTNKNAETARREAVRANAMVLQVGGQSAADLMEKIEIDVLAEHVLLGWDGFVDEKDQPLKYSVEAAKALLSNPAYKDFREDVVNMSQSRELFKSKQNKSDAETLKA